MLPTFNVPPVGTVQGKVWGKTQLLFAHNGTECHQIEFVKGGFCSIHTHHYKWNRFVVLFGTLKVLVHRDAGIIDETILQAGQVSDVPPGVVHQFYGVTKGAALEFYWTTLDAQDIERRNQGGITHDDP